MQAHATDLNITEDSIVVELDDGRTIAAPLAWSPRLATATETERSNWRFIGDGNGMHWPDIDEDVSVENLLAGKPSAESQASFKRWLETRAKV